MEWDSSRFSWGQWVKDLLLKFQFFKILAGLFFSKGSGTRDTYCFGNTGNVWKRPAGSSAQCTETLSWRSCTFWIGLSGSLLLFPTTELFLKEQADTNSRRLSPAESIVPATSQGHLPPFTLLSLPTVGHEHPRSPNTAGKMRTCGVGKPGRGNSTTPLTSDGDPSLFRKHSRYFWISRLPLHMSVNLHLKNTSTLFLTCIECSGQLGRKLCLFTAALS